MGLPDDVHAVLFDMDGVLTETSTLHAAAWKQMFDDYLKRRSERDGTPFVPFDAGADYAAYVDGKPRQDGTRSFLAARGITLPEGEPDDPPSAETVRGLGNRKNEIVQRKIEAGEVRVYPGSVRYLRATRDAGLRVAVVSSSANTGAVLGVTGLADLVDVRVDAQVAEQEQLSGKPAPDTFLAAARALGVSADQAAVFEDALAGVEAGRAGRFRIVIGVDRLDQAAELREHGADIVVTDLADLLESPR